MAFGRRKFLCSLCKLVFFFAVVKCLYHCDKSNVNSNFNWTVPTNHQNEWILVEVQKEKVRLNIYISIQLMRIFVLFFSIELFHIWIIFGFMIKFNGIFLAYTILLIKNQPNPQQFKQKHQKIMNRMPYHSVFDCNSVADTIRINEYHSWLILM